MALLLQEQDDGICPFKVMDPSVVDLDPDEIRIPSGQFPIDRSGSKEAKITIKTLEISSVADPDP
jgi:hypothetical protein